MKTLCMTLHRYVLVFHADSGSHLVAGTARKGARKVSQVVETNSEGKGFPRRHPRGQPIPNWCTLSRSDQVEVHRNGRPIATGRIDMLALDGTMLWILKEPGNDRALFLHSDGITIYRQPAQGTP